MRIFESHKTRKQDQNLSALAAMFEQALQLAEQKLFWLSRKQQSNISQISTIVAACSPVHFDQLHGLEALAVCATVCSHRGCCVQHG